MQLRAPRLLWLSLATVVLVVVAVGLGFGIPGYRHWRAVQNVIQYAGIYEVGHVAPAWLENRAGEKMRAFNRIEHIRFDGDMTRYCRLHGLRLPEKSEGGVISGGGGGGEVLYGRRVAGDAEMAVLRELPELRELGLACTNVTDAGLHHLSCLASLEKLDLAGTDVTDASIPVLKRLTNLRELSVRGTRVSDAGVAELQRAIPGLKVVR